MWGRANEWTALVEHAVVDDERLEADDGVARRQTAVERRVEGDDAVGVRAALTALDDDGCRVWVFVGVTTTSRGSVCVRVEVWGQDKQRTCFSFGGSTWESVALSCGTAAEHETWARGSRGVGEWGAQTTKTAIFFWYSVSAAWADIVRETHGAQRQQKKSNNNGGKKKGGGEKKKRERRKREKAKKKEREKCELRRSV